MSIFFRFLTFAWEVCRLISPEKDPKLHRYLKWVSLAYRILILLGELKIAFSYISFKLFIFWSSYFYLDLDLRVVDRPRRVQFHLGASVVSAALPREIFPFWHTIFHYIKKLTLNYIFAFSINKNLHELSRY